MTPALTPAEACTVPMTKAGHEILGLWESGWRVWLDYVNDLASATTQAALVDANARFITGCFRIPGFAAGEVQRDAGLKAPTLVEP